MKIQAQRINMQYDEAGQPQIVLTINGNREHIQQEVAELKRVIEKGKELTAEVKPYRRKRSLDSNSYLWVLCQKISEVIRATKEEIYKKVIREVGQFEIVPIKNEAVERWIEAWNSKGLGWFAEVMEDSKLPGYKKVISYYGSSVYDSKEFSVLLDYIVQDAKELDIETLPPDELARLMSEWGSGKEFAGG